jgi:putative membrane protein
MKHVIACLILASPLLAWSSSPDESFFKQAAEGGIAEVQAGKLAQSKGNSQAVKDFGAMMVKDHSAANEKLKRIAATENVDLPTQPSAAQMASLTKLEALSGNAFDQAYIKDQVRAHQRTVALFKKEIQSGMDQQAKSFASETLPTVESHLRKIRQIATDAGVSVK